MSRGDVPAPDPGPLPADHQYGIYLESRQVNQVRNETVTPVPRGTAQQRQQPQTRPK